MTDFLRKIFSGILNSIAKLLISKGVRPNMITFFGLLGIFCASYLIGTGKLVFGGLVLLILGPLDAIDGAVARLGDNTTNLGAFLDSVSDRYAEVAIFLGILIYAINNQTYTISILSYIAATGSLLVSYTRARAEALGADSKIGILTRVERFLIIIPALIFNQLLVGLIIIGVLSHLTAIQRIFYIRKQLES